MFHLFSGLLFTHTSNTHALSESLSHHALGTTQQKSKPQTQKEQCASTQPINMNCFFIIIVVSCIFSSYLLKLLLSLCRLSTYLLPKECIHF